MTVPASLRFRVWEARMCLADLLLNLGASVQPEHRYQHAYSADGQTITVWREPTDPHLVHCRGP